MPQTFDAVLLVSCLVNGKNMGKFVISPSQLLLTKRLLFTPFLVLSYDIDCFEVTGPNQF